MNIKPLLARSRNFITNPNLAWDKINEMQLSSRKHIVQYTIPASVVVGLLTFLGYLFVMQMNSYSFAFIISKGIAQGLICFFTMFVSVLIINECNKYFDTPKNVQKVGISVIYSMAPLYVAMAIAGFMANYKTLGSFLKVAGLFYGGYIFYLAGKKNIQVPAAKRQNYASVALIVFLFVYFMLNFSLGYITRIVFYATQ